MKILFVCSGNSKNGINTIVRNQGDSLRESGIEVEYFTIKGKRIISYLKHIVKLNKHLKNNTYDLIHAHYSFSAITATLAGSRPLVVSLMGSDIYANSLTEIIIRFFHHYLWGKTIVKSQRMKDHLKMKECEVLPNGVNICNFKPSDIYKARKQLALSKNKKYVLFAADPKRKEKNFALAKKALSLINSNDIELLIASNVPHELMPIYYNASDMLLVTSVYEGSINVVKEAMACNLPIISTDVGDVKHNISDVKGCYIVDDNAEDIKSKIIKVIADKGITNGREKIVYSGLDSKTIANKLIKIYEKVIGK